MDGVDAIRQRVEDWDEAVWQLAALVVVLDSTPSRLDDAAAELLATLGLAEPVGSVGGSLRAMLAGQARSPVLQAAALLSGHDAGWSQQPDEALLAQGRASGQAVAPFVEFVLPRLGDLGERLRRPDARMLDVGTGVGALAVAYAEHFPALHVVGIDVLPRVLALAERTLGSSPAGDRVELRRQSIAELDDEDGFDLAWVPAPFIPSEVLAAGLRRVAATMRGGGWVMLGHGKFDEDPAKAALTRFKTVAYGGTPLDAVGAQTLLREAGLTDCFVMPTPPGAPAITLARAR